MATFEVTVIRQGVTVIYQVEAKSGFDARYQAERQFPFDRVVHVGEVGVRGESEHGAA